MIIKLHFQQCNKVKANTEKYLLQQFNHTPNVDKRMSTCPKTSIRVIIHYIMSNLANIAGWSLGVGMGKCLHNTAHTNQMNYYQLHQRHLSRDEALDELFMNASTMSSAEPKDHSVVLKLERQHEQISLEFLNINSGLTLNICLMSNPRMSLNVTANYEAVCGWNVFFAASLTIILPTFLLSWDKNNMIFFFWIIFGSLTAR